MESHVYQMFCSDCMRTFYYWMDSDTAVLCGAAVGKVTRKVIQTLRVWTIISMHVWCLFPQVDDMFCGVYRHTHEKWSSQRSLNISVSNSTGGAGEGHPHRETRRPPWPPFCCGTAAVPAHHSGICSTTSSSSSPAGLQRFECVTLL